VRRLEQALKAALADPGVKEKLIAAGFSPKSSSAAELATLSATEYERLGKVARGANMSAD